MATLKQLNQLNDLISRKRNKEALKTNGISLNQVLQLVSTHFNVPVDEIKSESRKDDIVEIRHYYSWLAIHFTGYSQKEIAAPINRHQVSTIWSYNAINDCIKKRNKEKCSHLVALMRKLTAVNC